MDKAEEFKKELTERIDNTIDVMMNNSDWQKILSGMSREQITKVVMLAFAVTNIKTGSLDNFNNAINSLIKDRRL